MKRCIIIPFIIVPFLLFSQNREEFGYDDFKDLFSKHDSMSSNSSVIPHNHFTDFLFYDQMNLIYHAVEMMSINDDLDFFILRQDIIYDDEDDNVDSTIYLIFKGKQLVGEYNFYGTFRILEMSAFNSGVTVSQSYKIQDDKSISIEHYYLDCCSSTGFEIPIEIKTKIDFQVNDQGILVVKDVLEWEISSLFFNSDFQDSIAKNQKLLYPTAENQYNIAISDINAYIPITNNDDQIFFFFDCQDDKLVPVLISKNKEGRILDSLIIGKNMKETVRCKTNELEECTNFFSHPLTIIADDKQVKLSIDNNGRFAVEFISALAD